MYMSRTEHASHGLLPAGAKKRLPSTGARQRKRRLPLHVFFLRGRAASLMRAGTGMILCKAPKHAYLVFDVNVAQPYGCI